MPAREPINNYLKVQPKEPFPGGGKAAILIDAEECDNRARAELIELQPGEGFPIHTHPKSDHIILVVSGTGQLLWEGKELSIVTGDTFVVPMGDVHSIKAGDEAALKFVVINVPPIDFDHHDFMQPVESDDRSSH
jgi:quercetin dioxygenase-like cupin family protein